jgi:hypothetical protein
MSGWAVVAWCWLAMAIGFLLGAMWCAARIGGISANDDR